MNRIKYHFPPHYTGNMILFVLCIIFFLPLGVVLAIKNMKIIRKDMFLSLSYRGSYGWLFFWAILFFPVALLMLLLKGVDVIEWDA